MSILLIDHSVGSGEHVVELSLSLVEKRVDIVVNLLGSLLQLPSHLLSLGCEILSELLETPVS